MHALLERVSLIFQRNDLSIIDVRAEVNFAIDEIAKLAITCGKLKPSAQLCGVQARLLGREQLCHYMCC